MEQQQVNEAERKKQLRARLKDLRRQKRGGGGSNPSTLADQLKRDPAGAFLSLGIDDPELLKRASSIVKQPQQALQSIKKAAAEERIRDETDSDDEEAPPCLIMKPLSS